MQASGDLVHSGIGTGMRLVATEMRQFVSGEQLGEIWEITREEWRRHRAGG